MKILQIVIAMLIFAAPAFGITVRCSDEGNGVVGIGYDATDENTLPIGFALDITVDNGATIDDISGYKTGNSTAAEPGYGIFPRSVQFDDTGRLIDPGFPDVSPDGNTTGVKPGLGTNGITIEMGSRYSGAENAPLKKGMLFKINVNNHGAPVVNVTVTPNMTGGGVVLEDAAVADVTPVGCTLNYSDAIAPPVTDPPVIDPDILIITKAVYEVKPQKLSVEAMSSVQPNATLSVEGYGTMVWKARNNRYELSIRRAADPGGSITVTSSAGASVTRPVTLR